MYVKVHGQQQFFITDRSFICCEMGMQGLDTD